jgi:hypothetical protein
MLHVQDRVITFPLRLPRLHLPALNASILSIPHFPPISQPNRTASIARRTGRAESVLPMLKTDARKLNQLVKILRKLTWRSLATSAAVWMDTAALVCFQRERGHLLSPLGSG